MEQNINTEILDKLTKVCICKSVSKSSIKKAILKGSETVEEIKKNTGAGSGFCCGKRCTPKIEQLLKELK